MTALEPEEVTTESAFNKTCLYRRVRAPITKTRPNNTRQRAKSKKSATPTSKGKFYENADSANINVRRTVSDLLCFRTHLAKSRVLMLAILGTQIKTLNLVNNT